VGDVAQCDVLGVGEYIALDLATLKEKEAIMQAMTSWEEKGMEKERQAIALNMLKDNLPWEQIVRLTGLTIEQVQSLQAQVENDR
jgi:predicted transposase YdaD